MTPRKAFENYLRSAARPSAAMTLAASMSDAGHDDTAELLAAYAERGSGWCHPTKGPAAGNRTFVGPRPPANAVGSLWFDTCDLSLMLCLANDINNETFAQLSHEARARHQPTLGWLALEPVRGWQFGAFCDVAPMQRTFSKSHLPLVPFDPDRIDLDGEAPVTSASCAEAEHYLTWFGKTFPDEFQLQQMARQLGRPPWSTPPREWAGGASFDDSLCVVLSPEVLEADLAEIARTSSREDVFYSEGDALADATFRVAVSDTYGLSMSEQTPDSDRLGVKLERRFSRP